MLCGPPVYVVMSPTVESPVRAATPSRVRGRVVIGTWNSTPRSRRDNGNEGGRRGAAWPPSSRVAWHCNYQTCYLPAIYAIKYNLQSKTSDLRRCEQVSLLESNLLSWEWRRGGSEWFQRLSADVSALTWRRHFNKAFYLCGLIMSCTRSKSNFVVWPWSSWCVSRWEK